MAEEAEKTGCITVLTGKSTETIKKMGGSAGWKINRDNAKACKYCICIQNERNDDPKLKNQGGEIKPQGTAFLVGKVSEVVPSGEKDRYLIKFSEYAKINFHKGWGKGRNPFTYDFSLKDFGIDNPDKLEWKKMPEIDHETAETSPADLKKKH